MRTLHFATILVIMLSIPLIMELPHVQASEGRALFMKTNSTGQIFANFTFPVPNNRTWNLSSGIYLGLTGQPVQIDPKNMTIVAEPNSFVASKENVTVTYTITVKNNTKGIFALFLYLCGESPLIVGLNESEVSPDVYNQFFNAVYHCGVISGSTPKMNIIGYSNLISKIIDIDSNNTIKSVQTLGSVTNKVPSGNSTNSITQHNAAQPFPRNLVTPLKQLQMGIQAQNVICDWSGFELILKSEDGSPACVSSQTAQILMERGWGHFPLRLR
ncbi:MAG: hypothetical protein PXX83_01635 [Candidatus Nitrosotalea sp.]|nr:hypothetical protein [Candidatus Nitrosotalea sp.]